MTSSPNHNFKRFRDYTGEDFTLYNLNELHHNCFSDDPKVFGFSVIGFSAHGKVILTPAQVKGIRYEKDESITLVFHLIKELPLPSEKIDMIEVRTYSPTGYEIGIRRFDVIKEIGVTEPVILFGDSVGDMESVITADTIVSRRVNYDVIEDESWDILFINWWYTLKTAWNNFKTERQRVLY